MSLRIRWNSTIIILDDHIYKKTIAICDNNHCCFAVCLQHKNLVMKYDPPMLTYYGEYWILGFYFTIFQQILSVKNQIFF
jgi:hypothetical protein